MNDPAIGNAMRADAALADHCPRCGGPFHCGINDAGPCACTTVSLSGDQLAALSARYQGCLCLRCLGELASGAATQASQRSSDTR